ncbi:endonuclease VII [Vibrio phage phi-A318]|nr:endonuclease VII [Vibrio phage phi-A318]AGZ17747.1 hypothetical protein [Vibrio phage phi-A318]
MTELRKAISSRAVKHKDNPDNLPNIKKELIRRQNGKCPITGRDLRSMTTTNVVVDHDHKSGVIRAALPRAINGLEGKLTNLCIRWGGCTSKRDIINMLRGMADYLELHQVPQTEWIHPEHLTPAEARAKRNAKARKRYALKKKDK